jgi:Icc-related predicted phosphoesterase
MRFWIFSDLHLDVNAAFHVRLPERWPAHDAVVIAGDLCEGMAKGVHWIAAQGLNARPVIYVGGNHEFYGHDRYEELERARAAARGYDNIHVLDRDVLTLGDITVLGATLWTNYDLYGVREDSMALAERMMSDHRMIAHGAAAFSASSARAEHVDRVAWLEDELRAVRRTGRKAVVVSHHAPSPRSISQRFQGHPLTASFTSDLEHLFPSVALWVHGHTHRIISYEAAGCRVVNNPLGYLRHEITGFTDDLVVTV